MSEDEVQGYTVEVTEAPTITRTKMHYICNVCGENDVHGMAQVIWNIPTQQWVAEDGLDWDYDTYCNNCECEVSITETEI